METKTETQVTPPDPAPIDAPGAVPAFGFTEWDWLEDSALENGHYSCYCTSCGSWFYGHKRRVTCRVCAVPEPAAPLTDTELRIAVAKHLGYRVEPSGREDFPFSMFWPGGAHGGYWATEKLAWGQNVPHFEWSLDAMHEAEKTLLPFDSDKWQSYAFWLSHLTTLGGQDHATARQRAQAFCAVMGIKLP